MQTIYHLSDCKSHKFQIARSVQDSLKKIDSILKPRAMSFFVVVVTNWQFISEDKHL